MKQHNNIPQLRFPEFDGEWEEYRIKEKTSKIGSGKTPKGGEDVYVDEGIPFIRSQNVMNNSLILDGVCIPQAIHESMIGSSVKPMDILLNITGGSIGRSCVVPEDFIEGNVNQHVCIVRLRKDNPFFLHSLLSSWRGQKLVFQGQTGSGREGLNFESISKFKIKFPSLPEQQKIAQFLTAVDKRIQLLTLKKEQLELYKKGAMQKIFNREIRFKDENGKEFPEWEEKKLGEVFKFLSTNSFTRDKLNYHDGDVMNIHYGDIHVRFKTLFDINSENVPFINMDVDLSKIPDESYLKEGDVVIADASEDYDDIGKAIEIINTGNERVLAGLHTILARRLDESISVGFSGYLFENSCFRIKVKRIAQGAKVLGISSKRVGELSIHLPVKAEQQKIAQFLTALNKKIEHTTSEIEKMKEWKRGLLQKMFV